MEAIDCNITEASAVLYEFDLKLLGNATSHGFDSLVPEHVTSRMD